MRALLRLLLAGLFLPVLLPTLLATPSAADSPGLAQSFPAQGTTVAQAPTTVDVVFDQDVRTYYPLVVTGPDGGVWSTGEPSLAGRQLQQPVQPLGPAGTYEVRYRAVNYESTTIFGTFSFTLGEHGPGDETPALAATVDPGKAFSASSGSSDLPRILGVGAVVVVLLVLTGTALARRGDDAEPDQP